MKPKTVLVTGVFDVLHQEHLNFLKAAKSQGGRLLVGLETDARIQRLKGPNRPINPLKTRIKNLKKLKLADKVFSLPEKFSTPQDHENLIKKIQPNILAVSSHTPNQPQKKAIIEKYGGQLKIVHPHNPRISTTRILTSA
jgi:D-beta-D-heptose 7-phosphate kinase/D-beta-D-heptose 1-phosphate adenosyltransferase